MVITSITAPSTFTVRETSGSVGATIVMVTLTNPASFGKSIMESGCIGHPKIMAGGTWDSTDISSYCDDRWPLDPSGGGGTSMVTVHFVGDDGAAGTAVAPWQATPTP